MGGPLLIGISGASSSGKTTVTKLLHEIIPNCSLVHEDNFYFPDAQIPYNEEINEQNWDCPEAIDFAKFATAIGLIRRKMSLEGSGIKTTTPNFDEDDKPELSVSSDIKARLRRLVTEQIGDHEVVLVDGFLMYHNSTLLDMLDIKLFIKADYKTLKTRRESRVYTIDEGTWTDPPGYFDKCVWPAYYEYHRSLFVDGDDEDLIKNTGGTLNEHSVKDLMIDAFDNSDGTQMEDLLQRVFEAISARCHQIYH